MWNLKDLMLVDANGLLVNVRTYYMFFYRARIKVAGLPVLMQRNIIECVTKKNKFRNNL